MIYKTLQRKLKIEQHKIKGELRCSRGLAVPALLMAPVVSNVISCFLLGEQVSY